MKFACLGYFDENRWNAMPKAEQDAMMEKCFAFDDILLADGKWTGDGQVLQSAQTAKTLRWKSNQVIVTDGPYAESKEQIGGLGVLEARDMSEAIEILSKHPALRDGAPFELRPIDEDSPCAARLKARKTATQIFVNLPVKDLNRSIEFFSRLGFEFNPQFTDETATCMIVSDTIFVMLLTEAKFREFTPKRICDATKVTEVLVCLSRRSRNAVDDLVRKAVAAGGTTFAESRDYGFMYQHGFQDLDGHLWELIHMDPQGVPRSEEALVA
jgi:predicted lactoylglutathione lyase